MSSANSVSPSQLFARFGALDAPFVVDVRIDEDFAADPRLVPTARRFNFRDDAAIAAAAQGREAVVVCHKGLKLSEGVAALLRTRGLSASVLEGGAVAWAEAGLPAVPASVLPSFDYAGGSRWVTRERPKIDRIACPWLIRRFVDPSAQFLFVNPGQVAAVADKFDATPFDIEGVRWSHVGETCTFDTMIAAFGLETVAMRRLARIVRGADTAALDLEPQAAGLLAVSLGLSRLYRGDLAQLDAGMILYDALYRWCRDAVGETHNWPAKGA